MKIWYENFYPGFDPKEHDFFSEILGTITDVEITPNDPDLVVYQVFGDTNRVLEKYKCKKALFLTENIITHTNPWKKIELKDYPCDFSVTFYPESDTNIQSQFWLTMLNYRDPNSFYYYKNTENKREFSHKTEFCNFIYSNPATGFSPRYDFFKFLSKKRFIHSAGRFAKNIEGGIETNVHSWHDSKVNYLRKFAFTISFENSYHEHYTTEKILDPLLSSSVPVYWGGQESVKDFNSNTFINAYDRSFEEVENEMINLLENTEKLIEMCTLPIFEKFPEKYLPETIATKIMDQLERK